MTYQPDNWVVLKIPYKEEAVYKVLASWSGGYSYGDSWRINSGITEVKQDGDYYEFYGHTGSCYRVHKNTYRLTMAISGVYNSLKEEFDVTLMPENTNWAEIKYENSIRYSSNRRLGS